MATILPPNEQAETSALARRVGGYDVMLRLERELKALEDRGTTARIERDPVTQHLSVVAA
jgi:hypothetical protein